MPKCCCRCPWLALVFLLLLSAPSARADLVKATVVGPDGKPVPGATVTIYRVEMKTYKPQTVATKTTGADGVFSADLDEWKVPKGQLGVPDGKLYGGVSIYKSGLAIRQGILTDGATFTLDAAAPIKGTVVNKDGKPVVGVTVAVAYFSRSRGNGYHPEDSISPQMPGMEDLLQTKTAADGSFIFACLTAVGQGSVQVRNTDYAGSYAAFRAGEAIKITVKPGAHLRGRVVDTDGKPVAGVGIYASSDKGGGQATTGADGTYRVGGLEAGTYSVSMNDPKDEHVALTVTGILLPEAGEGVAKDLIATVGARIEVAVIDAETGAPIPMASISYQSPNTPANSYYGRQGDAEGKITLRASAGVVRVMVNGSPEGYLAPPGGVSAEANVKDGETRRISIALQKGLHANCQAVDEMGRPLAGIKVRLYPENDTYRFQYDQPEIKTDAQGRWEETRLPRDGKPLKFTAGQAWTVVEPASVTLDPKKLSNSPLVVTLKKTDLRAVSGRVIDPSGKPLSGVGINVFTFTKDESGNYTGETHNENTNTDAQGNYSVVAARPGESARVNPYQQGYRYLRGGKVEKTDDGLFASDIVMAPLDATVAGRVVNEKNTPVPGALVWCAEAGPNAHALTDANGRFTLKDLVAGNVTIAAGKGSRITSGRGTARTGTPKPGAEEVILTLEEASATLRTRDADMRRADSLLARSRQEVKNFDTDYLWNSVSVLALVDPNRALASLSDNGGKISEANRAGLIQFVSRYAPADRVFAWAPDQLAQILQAPDKRVWAAGEMGIALAVTHPDIAEQCYQELAGYLRGGGDANADQYARALALGTLLHKDSAEMATFQARVKASDPWAVASACGSILCRADLDLAKQMLDALPKEYRATAFRSLIEQAAKTSPRRARDLLLEWGKDVPQNEYWQQTQWAQALIRVVRALGPSDPEGALALAHSPMPGGAEQYKATALAAAAPFQKGAAITATWHEAMTTAEATRQGDAGPRFALLAARCKVSGGPADVTRDLWARAKEHVEAAPYMNNEETFIYYAGAFDPAYARMIADRAADRVRNTVPDTDNWYSLVSCALALGPTDPDRAAALFEETVGKEPIGQDTSDYNRRYFRACLATLLLLPPDIRWAVDYETMRSSSQDDWLDGIRLP
jgi:protocatechuate 3,4-dioxygenase beta subunit